MDQLGKDILSTFISITSVSNSHFTELTLLLSEWNLFSKLLPIWIFFPLTWFFMLEARMEAGHVAHAWNPALWAEAKGLWVQVQPGQVSDLEAISLSHRATEMQLSAEVLGSIMSTSRWTDRWMIQGWVDEWMDRQTKAWMEKRVLTPGQNYMVFRKVTRIQPNCRKLSVSEGIS